MPQPYISSPRPEPRRPSRRSPTRVRGVLPVVVFAGALLSMLLMTAGPATAAPHWGDFKDNGCVSKDNAPGLRSLSAVLWGIPPGQSWEEHCARTPATIAGQRFSRPPVCVNTSVPTLDDPNLSAGLGAAGEFAQCVGLASNFSTDTIPCFENLGVKAGKHIDIAHEANSKPGVAVAEKAVIRPWPLPAGGAPLHGAVPQSARSTWKSTLRTLVERQPTKQVKQHAGGLNIWGVFLVPDDKCLPPTYHKLPNASWDKAAGFCKARGMKLCERKQLCQGGQPVVGSPQGDVWLATGDHPNAWTSVGTALPERMCKSHEQVAGAAPAWGTDKGPLPVTGQPTMFRCCP